MKKAILWLLIMGCGVSLGGPTFFKSERIPGVLLNDIQTISNDSIERQSFQFEHLNFQKLNRDQYQINLPGLESLMVAGKPRVPFFTRKIVVPKGKKIRVTLSNVVLEETASSVPLKMVPPIYEWSENLSEHDFEAGDLFPGKLIKTLQSHDEAYVNLYPVQVSQSTGKVYVVRSGEMAIEFEAVLAEELKPSLFSSSYSDAVIITAAKYKKAADLLKFSHERTNGFLSEVVTVEWIEAHYDPVDEKYLPLGYKNGDGVSQVLPYDKATGTGYDFILAKKIMAYLRSRMIDSDPLKYVVLLGDVASVPPSYYFSSSRGIGVTDQCYGSANRCADPKLAVGRLPFTTLEQTQNYLEKVQAWKHFAEHSSYELSLYGGKAFPGSEVYVGELGTLKLINASHSNWHGVKKYFRTAGTFQEDQVRQLFSGESDSPFVYYLDHGMGNQLFYEDSAITSKEILNLKPQDDHYPILVSVSCTNAAFDSELVRNRVFGELSNGKHSIGEAFLLSEAGGVAYLGSTRPAIGTPVHSVDESGNLTIDGTNYMLLLLDTILETYQKDRNGRLGDIVIKGMRKYIFESGNDPSKDHHRWTYLGFSLLGDPTLSLPARHSTQRNEGIANAIDKLQKSAPFPKLVVGIMESVQFAFNSKVEVLANLLAVKQDYFSLSETVVLTSEQRGLFQLEIPIPTEEYSRHLVRLENQEGVPSERRVWIDIENVPKDKDLDVGGDIELLKDLFP